MKKRFFFIAVVFLTLFISQAFSQYFTISDIKEYETVAQTRLTITVDTHGYFFPPNNFYKWIVLISTKTMGVTQPYDYVVRTESTQKERTFEIQLLAPISGHYFFRLGWADTSGNEYYTIEQEFDVDIETAHKKKRYVFPYAIKFPNYKTSLFVKNLNVYDPANCDFLFVDQHGNIIHTVGLQIEPNGLLVGYLPSLFPDFNTLYDAFIGSLEIDCIDPLVGECVIDCSGTEVLSTPLYDCGFINDDDDGGE